MISDAVEDIRQIALVSLNEIVASLPVASVVNLVRKFITTACTLGPLDHYKHFNLASRQVVDEIRTLGGPPMVRMFLVVAVKQSVIDLVDGHALASLPARAYAHHIVQLRRIASSMPDQTSWQDVNDDLFQKDFGLATLRLYAAAAQLVDFRCGISRTILIRGGYKEFPARAMTLLRVGGFRPYFQIHTHLSYLDEFNKDGWNECYLTCCELYNRHPTVLGMFGASWFYDPGLEDISPRLRYLRHIPVEGKAQCWLMESTGHFVEDAIATSPTRRQLYEQGKYQPHSFILLWAKRDQMQWAENYSRDHARRNNEVRYES